MKFIRLLFILSLSALTSCNTLQYYNLPVNHPPVVVFNSPTTIVIINKFDLATLGIKNKKKLNVVKGSAYEGLNFAASELGRLPNVKVIDLIDTAEMLPDTNDIRSLAIQYHADYILALNYFNASFDLDGLNNYYTDKGETISTADYSLRVKTNYVMYDSSGNVYRRFDANVNGYKTTQETPGYLFAALFGPTIKSTRNTQRLNRIAIQATREALQGYVSYITVLKRPLYADDALKEAVNLMLNNRFDTAEPLLRDIIDNGETQLSARAAYDLAVLYEAQGEIDRAREMAQASLAKDDASVTRNMLNTLR